MPRRARLNTCPSRRRRSKQVRTSPRPPRTRHWLPGCWVWQQNRYAWRPGYWAAGNQDWDWMPAHYVWTPRGYVFVDGYYDYSVPRRGVLFAPVYFDGGLRTQRGFSYSPSTVINPGVFASHLFLRPGYGHYYFGDYYGSNYSDAGFSPWFSFQSSRRGYDPIYANQRWQHRQDRDWEHRTRVELPQLPRPRRRPAATHLGSAKRTRRSVGIRPTEATSRLPHRSTSWPGKKTVGSDSNRWTRATNNSLASAGKRTVSTSQQRQQLEANAARTPGGDPATATGPARKNFHDLPSWQRPPISLARTTLRHNDTKFSSQTFRSSPSPERVAAKPGTRQVL